MTYILGLRDSGTSLVICDTRVTFDDAGKAGMNYSLKSGLFFPGCHYAGAGYTRPMRRFIVRCKKNLTGRDSLTGFWSRFVEFASRYDEYDEREPFELLLTSRHTGTPEFHIFRSSSRSVERQGDLVTLGTGRTILDPVVHQLYRAQHADMMDQLRQQELPAYCYGYFYCLALMEYVQGDAYQQLERDGVGGVFHFSYQTATNEHRQDPAVYVIVTPFPERKTLTFTLYRVTFERMALVVENGASRSLNISIDPAAWPRALELSARERSQLADLIQEGAIGQPFYNFCGFGFADTKYRGSWITQFNNGTQAYLLDRNTLQNSAVMNIVQGVVTGELQKAIGNKQERRFDVSST